MRMPSPPNVSDLKLERQPGIDTHRHGMGEDYLSIWAPNAQHVDVASAQPTELP